MFYVCLVYGKSSVSGLYVVMWGVVCGSYKAAKKLNNILNQHLHLENLYTVENSTKLANDLTKITLKDSYRLITLDIKDLYVNILIHEALQATRTQLHKHNDKTFTNQICTLLEAMLNQNYFTYQTQIYQPTKGVAMDSPISGLITEIFLQSLERTHIKPLLDTIHTIFYTTHIDDILIIYDTAQINLDTITHYANTKNNNLELCPTPKQNNRVSFLDLAIIRNTPHLEIDIFQKPTTTDTTISYFSNHPQEQKSAAYRFLIDRMFNLPLHKNRLENEWQTILHIPKNNHFPTALIHNLRHRMIHKEPNPHPPPSPHIPGRTKNGPLSPSYPQTSGRSLTYSNKQV